VTIGSQEYARVGNRLYTHHAVERTYPSSLGTAVGGVKGRSVAPGYIQEVLSSPGTTRIPVTGPLGEARVSHVSGSLEVITEGDIVITVMTH
jgi:filamentous hemagglutinin